MKKNSGFTLVELLVTVAVLAVLTGLAAPSMVDLVRNNRVASTASSFGGAISYARAEAVKRGQQVVLCHTSTPAASAPACSNTGGWQQGWLIFVDANADAAFTAGETVLRVWENPSPDAQIASTNHTVAFNSRGMPTSTDTFSICMGTLKRELAMNASGRLHISEGTCS